MLSRFFFFPCGPDVEPVRKSLSEGRSTNNSISGASSTGWTDVFKAVKNSLRYTSLSEKFLSSSSRMPRGTPTATTRLPAS
ncbi:hypothetical protein Y032_0093g2613 [Ancylostoma ceylanicum]|uniref:Uncharacterized protein n=1 Tax=Ancylostoma ceylanicum TaxID=53326 RepID=A0A016TLF8_9BILA|nr:hypothetical protein Y032_0093g2613 [Ancylostoma ceylanicum]